MINPVPTATPTLTFAPINNDKLNAIKQHKTKLPPNTITGLILCRSSSVKPQLSIQIRLKSQGEYHTAPNKKDARAAKKIAKKLSSEKCIHQTHTTNRVNLTLVKDQRCSKSKRLRFVPIYT